PSATRASPSTSHRRWSSTGRRSGPNSPASGARERRRRERPRAAGRRREDPPAGLPAPLRARPAGARFEVVAIPRNFDAGGPEPAGSLTIALHPAGYIKTMNDFSRTARVLVVEDDEDIAQALQRSLRMEGYEVRTAADGEAALEQGRAFAPVLVILDLGLPKIDGIEVARSLRSSDDVPILILTARDALESRVEGLDSGADDYLVKPFERQELLARMRALLRRRPPRGSAPLRVADLTLNADTHEVQRGERQ